MPTKTLMTASEFARTGPETDGFELVRGELVPMPPPRGRHSEVCSKVNFALRVYKNTRGRGAVLGNDGGIVTEKDPDTVRGADVAMFLNPSWDGPAPNRYFDEPPDLAVEVRSDGQSWKELTTKIDEYLQMGVPMAWIVDPTTERLTVFRPDEEAVTFASASEFDGGDLLPGLRFEVAELFLP